MPQRTRALIDHSEFTGSAAQVPAKGSKAQTHPALKQAGLQDVEAARPAGEEPRQRGHFPGNQARLRMLAENKRTDELHMGTPNNPLEVDATRSASAVLRMTDEGLSSRAPGSRRKASLAEARKSGAQFGSDRQGFVTEDPAPLIVHEALQSPGHPLDSATKSLMEPAFGQDFSQVRIHSGPLAERSARAVNARAYSVGNEIVLGTGQFSAESRETRETLAHELTHVAQGSSAHGDAARVVRCQPNPQTAPMPTGGAAHQPVVTPIILTEHDRDGLKLATVGNIGPAFTEFVTACKEHMESIKAADKAKNEMVAALVSVFFGLAAPVFSSWLMGAGGKMVADNLASFLTTESAKKVKEVVKGADVLKEGFKAIGALTTTAIKMNPKLLFGESDVDAFGNQLIAQFHAGVSALINAVSFDTLSDEALIATFFAYSPDMADVFAYRKALEKIFDEFKSLVRPIGRESYGNEAMSSETKTRGVWVVQLGGEKKLFVSRKYEVLYPPGYRSLDNETLRPVPDDIKPFVIAKTIQEFGNVETIISPDESARLAAEAEKARRPRPIVTPIPVEEAAASTGDWMARELAKNGLTPEIHDQIQEYLREYQGNAREIFIAHLKKGWKPPKP